MSPLLIATFATLSCWFSTTQSLKCEPSTRYGHPLNCSLFIVCDNNRNPTIFQCPDGLAFNVEKSYCDWPENSECPIETKEVSDEGGAVGENTTSNVTSAVKDNTNFVKAVKTIIEKMHSSNNMTNDTNNNNGTDIQTEDSGEKENKGQPNPLNKTQPNDEAFSGEKKQLKRSEEEISHISESEATDEDVEKGINKREAPNSREEHNISDGLKTSKNDRSDDEERKREENKNNKNVGSKVLNTSRNGENVDNLKKKTEVNSKKKLQTLEKLTIDKSIKTKENVREKKVHSVSRRQNKAEKIPKSLNKLGNTTITEEVKSETKSEKVEEYKSTGKRNLTLYEAASFIKAEKITTLSSESGSVPGTNFTFPKVTIPKNNSSLVYIFVPFNSTADDPSKNLGYEIISNDTENSTTENTHISTFEPTTVK